MAHRPTFPANIVFSPGTRVVLLRDVLDAGGRVSHPRGAVGVVVRLPQGHEKGYRVRFPDGVEVTLAKRELMLLSKYKADEIGHSDSVEASYNLYDHVIYRCVIGSRAYGLDDDHSDTDRRGIYVPPGELQWSLYGVPDQLENDATEEVYWEIQKFLVLALKANPNVLECLFTPVVELATPLAEELLEMRTVFVTRLIYQTFNGYVLSQFKRMEAHLRNHGNVKWKHVMHLIRLLKSGTRALQEGIVPVRVEEDRDTLLAIKRGEVPWEEVDAWRQELHAAFDQAYEQTRLPERPDHERVNRFLIRVRHWAAST
jgi:predicted nucleotidyltransferase